MRIPLDHLASAWHEAAEELGLEVMAPYSVGSHVFVAWVALFGSVKGTVIDLVSSDAVTAELSNAGYYVSRINPEIYAAYDRQLFVATLDDWGWHGEQADTPRWYSGSAWTV